MILAFLAGKLRRIVSGRFAERSARREPAAANSLGRVVPAAWTAAGLASAASPWGKPAGAGCAPAASAERSGFPGRLNGGRGGSRTQRGRSLAAFIPAAMLTSLDAGLDAAKRVCRKDFRTHARCKCPLTVCADALGDSLRRSRSASPGWAGARSGSRGSGGA